MESHDPLAAPIRGVVLRAGAIAWSLIGILVLGYIFLRYLVAPVSVIVAPVLIAIVIVFLLNPVVRWLQGRRVPRWLAITLVVATWLGLLVVLLSWLIPRIVEQITAFVDVAPEYTERMADRINDFAAARGFEWRIDLEAANLQEFFAGNRDQIIRFLGGIGSIAGQVVHAVVLVVIGVVLSVYILADLPGMGRRMNERLPDAHRDDIKELGRKVAQSFGGFFRGQMLVATFVGVASALALTWPVKLQFAMLIGLIAGIFNLVPLIGPFLAMVPAFLIGVLSGNPIQGVWAVLALLAVQQIDNHVVSPPVMSRSVQLHPITVMLGILVGGTLAGIPGMLISIPLIATSKIVAVWLWARQGHMFEVPAQPATSQASPD